MSSSQDSSTTKLPTFSSTTSTPTIRILQPPPTSPIPSTITNNTSTFAGTAPLSREQHASLSIRSLESDRAANISPVFSSSSAASSSSNLPLNRTTSPTVPMAIPNSAASKQGHVPPPLPPPRHMSWIAEGQDAGWEWGNRSPIDGSLPSRPSQRAANSTSPGGLSPDSRDSRNGNSPEKENTQHGKGESLPSIARLTSENRLSIRSLSSSAHQFDRQILNKLDRPDPKRGKFPGPLKPLSVPDRQLAQESPSRLHSSPLSSFSASSLPLPSPSFESPLSRMHQQRDSYHEDSRPGIAQRHSVDQSFSDSEHPFDEQSRKRRAPSPTHDERTSPFRGDFNNYPRLTAEYMRNSSTHVFRVGPSSGSVSSTGSFAPSMRSSYVGSPSAASSVTSYNSDRYSSDRYHHPPPYPPHPQDYPPPPPREFSYAHHHRMPPSSMSNRPEDMPFHGRTWFTCECCYKKPKRFNTEQELRAHENEKQYQCQYCPNRFKNKNEAERHQNSLHLRRYSWSCAALHSPATAFHPSNMTVPLSTLTAGGVTIPSPESPPKPGSDTDKGKEITNTATHDICGYCGRSFPNPPNWDLRSEHLVHEHKFGECNQHKKFYRADHFRQHLKHSHSAGSGKWTNVLENTCMRDEPLPVPLRQQQQIMQVSQSVHAPPPPSSGSIPPQGAHGVMLPPPGPPPPSDHVTHSNGPEQSTTLPPLKQGAGGPPRSELSKVDEMVIDS